MIIKNSPGTISSYKMWSLDPTLTMNDIKAKLSGVVNLGRSGDGKSTNTWKFIADGKECSIWDYKGVRWSGYGPKEVFVELGFLAVNV